MPPRPRRRIREPILEPTKERLLTEAVASAPATAPDPDRLHFLSVAVVERDIDHVVSMMRASGAATIDSLLLSALYNYSQHLDCGVPTTAFDLIRNRPIGRQHGRKD